MPAASSQQGSHAAHGVHGVRCIAMIRYMLGIWYIQQATIIMQSWQTTLTPYYQEQVQ